MMNNKPFFRQFKDFACNLGNNISNLNNSFENHPGKYPKDYYKGLNELQNEIQNLKVLEAETSKKISNISEFSFFVKSVKELIEEQDKDVHAMELYLERFGYKIPEKKEIVKNNDPNENQSEEMKDTHGNRNAKTAPDIQEYEYTVKDHQLSQQIQGTTISKENVPVIGLRHESELDSTPTCDTSVARIVEQWLRHPDNENNIRETPVKDNESEVAFLTKTVQQSSVTVANCSTKDLFSTLEEPNIVHHIPQQYSLACPNESSPSYYTAFEDSENQMRTPDDPLLASETKDNAKTQTENVASTTLHLMRERCQEVNSPQLSEITQKVLNLKTFHECPKASNRAPVATGTPPKNDLFEEPKTPQLSEITLKNLKTFHEWPKAASRAPVVATGTPQKYDLFEEPKTPQLSEITLKVIRDSK